MNKRNLVLLKIQLSQFSTSIVIEYYVYKPNCMMCNRYDTKPVRFCISSNHICQKRKVTVVCKYKRYIDQDFEIG